MQHEIGGTYYLASSFYFANSALPGEAYADVIPRGTAVILRAVTPILSLLAERVTLATIETVSEGISVYSVVNFNDLTTSEHEAKYET